MSTIDELRSVLREWTRGDRTGPAETYVVPILRSAIREIDRLTAEIARLKGNCNFLTKEVDDLAARLGEERSYRLDRIAEIGRLTEENVRLKAEVEDKAGTILAVSSENKLFVERFVEIAKGIDIEHKEKIDRLTAEIARLRGDHG